MDKELLKLKTIIGIELNVPKGAVDKKTREAEYVRARIIYANILMRELNTPIGKMASYMNRDRSSFYHYKKIHNTAVEMPRFYKDYLENYNNIVEAFLGDGDVMLKRWEMEFDELAKAQKAINSRIKAMEGEMDVISG